FILAVPGRRHGEFVDVLQAFEGRATRAEQELIEEASWHDLRLVVAHHPQRTETSAAQTRPAKSVDKDNYSDVR
ncbi:MAG: hypothetical protein NDI87_14230, partial [Rhodoferax sp.]|nr:hypothetical protein [Rhodoferax sp.]